MTMKFYICVAIMIVSACAGPSKQKLTDLLRECRKENRQRGSIIRMYHKSGCNKTPAPEFGALDFDEAGN